MRYVIDLDGHGRIFKMNLRNLGVSFQPKYHQSGAKSDLDFVYNESASQILLAYEPDQHQFLIKLSQLPDIKFFAHLDIFRNHLAVQQYVSMFREFGIGLMFQIHRRLGNRLDVDYLLEAIADDYIVLFQDIKRI